MNKKVNSQLKIESGIPLPPKRAAGSVAILRTMKIGDSVLMSEDQATVTARGIQAFGKGNYATRKEVNGVRLWRTA